MNCQRCGAAALERQRFCGECGAPLVSPGEPVATSTEERRQLTVMFCDLVGLTPIGARLDPEDFRDVVAAYHRSVTEQIARVGGFTARYTGDGVRGQNRQGRMELLRRSCRKWRIDGHFWASPGGLPTAIPTHYSGSGRRPPAPIAAPIAGTSIGRRCCSTATSVDVDHMASCHSRRHASTTAHPKQGGS
jgi:class 3 adenylate cyclase